ncbi:hypothetical protein [Endothiovibrio diazotrophicus]
MSRQTLLTFAESPFFPNFSALYARLGIAETRVSNSRKALAQVKKTPPDWIVAEFIYAWANNYASNHIGNLDVLLISLPKFAPASRVIVLAKKEEMAYAQQLRETYPFAALLQLPVNEEEMEAVLRELA